MTAVTWDDGIDGPTEPTWEPELYRTPETRHALQAELLDLSRRMAERGLSPWTFAEAIALLDAPRAEPAGATPVSIVPGAAILAPLAPATLPAAPVEQRTAA